MMLTACGGRGGEGGALPPPPSLFAISMRNFAYEHASAAPAGRVVLLVRNDGTTAHSLSLVVLPEDFPPLAEQLRGPERRAVPILGSISELAAGSTDSFAVELAPGRYGFVCNIRFPDGTTHGTRGMSSEFRVPAIPS